LEPGHGCAQRAQISVRTHDGAIGSDDRSGGTPTAQPTSQLAAGWGDVKDNAHFVERGLLKCERSRRGDNREADSQHGVEPVSIHYNGIRAQAAG
jgi:hypothetical protein